MEAVSVACGLAVLSMVIITLLLFRPTAVPHCPDCERKELDRISKYPLIRCEHCNIVYAEEDIEWRI